MGLGQGDQVADGPGHGIPVPGQVAVAAARSAQDVGEVSGNRRLFGQHGDGHLGRSPAPIFQWIAPWSKLSIEVFDYRKVGQHLSTIPNSLDCDRKTVACSPKTEPTTAIVLGVGCALAFSGRRRSEPGARSNDWIDFRCIG